MSDTPCIISNIQRFSVDDGPGIRTTVFFKGCNLACLWCHNPECISPRASLQFMEQSCTRCGRCVEACPRGVHRIEEGVHTLSRRDCLACGKCADACRAGALTLVGRAYSPEELLAVLLKDRDYYENSQGGVTCSGGEPMLQIEGLSRLLKLCKQAGLHTAVDTAGRVPFSSFERILPDTDVFLYDIKLYDAQKHREATGADNALILENLKKLTQAGAHVIIRTPVICEVNADLSELDAIASFLAPLEQIDLVQLLPYHAYGAGKYDTLGMENRIQSHTPPTQAFMEEALALFLEKGLCASIS